MSTASTLKVAFSVPKTELIHWRTRLQRGPLSQVPITLQHSTFNPSPTVRWLGYWLTPSLASSAHFSKRLALAEGALAIIRQLSPPGKGVPPHLNHRLITGLLFPILTYGADLLVPTAKMLAKLNSFWNKALRWCTNLFSTTPVNILASEACILPLGIAILRKRRMSALRIACASPLTNPATARTSTQFPSHSKYRSPESCRRLIPPRAGTYTPLSWLSSPRLTPGSTTHLPLDALLHTISLIHSPGFRFPEHPPPPSAPDTALPQYITLRKAINLLAIHEWSLLPMPPEYSPTYFKSPHPFMGLDRFTAGRIHQMRSGKSYLADHPSWHSPAEASRICPRCDTAPEDMSHAVLRCPATEAARVTYMPSIRSISPDAPLWSSTQLLLELSRFIHATRLNYPPPNSTLLSSPPTPSQNSPPPLSPLSERATPLLPAPPGPATSSS